MDYQHIVDYKPIIGITMGDPTGIGPEICVKALWSSEVGRIASPVIIGDTKVIRQAIKIAKVPETEINPIGKIEEAKFIKGTINVFDLKNIELSKIKAGKVSIAAGRAAIEYIKTAVDLALEDQISAIATAPINKEAIHMAGFKYDGHTELLAERTKAKNYGMMFVSDSFWLMLATTHLPLKDVSKYLTTKKILNAIKLAHKTIKELRHIKPRIGVAGLNPHAGEHGIFGKEDQKIIKPAVDQARRGGIDVKGPISPDAIFYLANVGMFDLVVAMYHDQGLIPLKLLSFNRSVNVTVGLPIIRTSVDHGTGFDIAGKGMANPSSLVEAIKLATIMVKAKSS